MDMSEAGKLGYEKTRHIHEARLQEKSEKCRADYEANPKFCLNCGEKLPFEKRRGKFCNHSCSASYTNRGAAPHNIKRSNVCSCGKPKIRQNKYCKDCADNHVYSKKTSLDQVSSDRMRRKILLEQHGHRCEGCGLSEWRGQPIPLDLHHIDGNSDNNIESNLSLLCPNCHALTETYKGANKGKNSTRQRIRRQRYANGQSW